MKNEDSNDHSFLLCELAAILAVLASAPMAAAQTAAEPTATTETVKQTSQGSRQPITYDHVYGSKRLSIGGFAPTRMTWLDDDLVLIP